jgi:hypothetical protein
MNPFQLKKIAAAVCRLAVVLAVSGFLQARGAETAVHSRWLLVFDASATMKKLLPGTEAALKKFFTTGADGQIQPGDSIAVWVIDQQINGQFPTFTAGATNAGMMVTNLVRFLHRQPCLAPSHLAVLQSPLNRVVAGSRRLTVILFTDGQSDIAGTPYDDGVNQTFRDVQADRRKNQQPVVVVMRSQFGKFTGCTLGFPPADISYPPFPALPPPSATGVARATNPPVPMPPVTPPPTASLVIVGNQVITNSGTNIEAYLTSGKAPGAAVTASNPPPAAAATNLAVVAPPATNLPAPAPGIASNPPPTMPPPKKETPLASTATNAEKPVAVVVPPPPAVLSNPPVSTATATQVVAKPVPAVPATNTIAGAAESDGGRPRVFVYAGIGVLAALLIVAILLVRPRRPESSLISRSMDDDRRGK